MFTIDGSTLAERYRLRATRMLRCRIRQTMLTIVVMEAWQTMLLILEPIENLLRHRQSLLRLLAVFRRLKIYVRGETGYNRSRNHTRWLTNIANRRSTSHQAHHMYSIVSGMALSHLIRFLQFGRCVNTTTELQLVGESRDSLLERRATNSDRYQYHLLILPVPFHQQPT